MLIYTLYPPPPPLLSRGDIGSTLHAAKQSVTVYREISFLNCIIFIHTTFTWEHYHLLAFNVHKGN